MKNLYVLWVVLSLSLVLRPLPLSAAPATPASREAQWKSVEEAIQKGLPRTAITILEPTIAGALREKAWGEATKAIARRIVLEGNIEGNKPEEKITRLETEISRAPKEIVPLLETLRATWCWHYFQRNRWRFMQRTATSAPSGKDFTTWDLPRLFAEIDARFTMALSAVEAPKLKAIRVHQDLLRFHEKDKEPAALLLADIERLQFGENMAFGESKHARYKTAFTAIADKWPGHELSGYATYRRARVLQKEDDLV